MLLLLNLAAKYILMKKWLWISIAVVAGLPVCAQTADDVIAKYVEALGGIEKLGALQSLYMEGVAVGPNGNEITTRTYKVQGKLYRNEVDFGMGTMTSVITDQEGWFSNPRNGGSFESMPAEMRNNQLAELDCLLPLVNYASKGHKAELTGTETIDGATCYAIRLTLQSGKIFTYYIENKNWMVVRSTTKARRMMMGGGGGRGRDGGQPPEEVEVNTDYSDYKKTPEGYWFPMTITRPGMGGRGMSTTIEKIEINKPVDPRYYKPE